MAASSTAITDELSDTKKLHVEEIKSACLNNLNIAEAHLELYECFNAEKLFEILLPDLFNVAIDNNIYQPNKSHFEEIIRYNKNVIISSQVFYTDVLKLIEDEHLNTETMLSKFYDFIVENNYFLKLAQNDVHQVLQNKVHGTSYDLLKNAVDVYYKKLFSFSDESTALISDVIDSKQKVYWEYVEPLLDSNQDKLSLVKRVKLFEISMKFNKITVLSVQYINEIRNNITDESRPFLQNFEGELQNINKEIGTLMDSRLVLQRTQGAYQSMESTRATFYQIYEAIEKISVLRKEFTDELFKITERNKLLLAQKSKEAPLSSEANLKEAEEEMRNNLEKETQLTILRFNEGRQKKQEEYQESVRQKREEKEKIKKEIVRKIKAGDGASISTLKRIRRKLQNCILNESSTIKAILQNSDKISKEAIDQLLPKIGFSIEPTAKQGNLFKLQNYSVSYHSKHPSDSKAGFVDINFVRDLRKIFWNIGINETFVGALLNKANIKTASKKTDEKSNNNSFTALYNNRISQRASQPAQSSSATVSNSNSSSINSGNCSTGNSTNNLLSENPRRKDKKKNRYGKN